MSKMAAVYPGSKLSGGVFFMAFRERQKCRGGGGFLISRFIRTLFDFMYILGRGLKYYLKRHEQQCFIRYKIGGEAYSKSPPQGPRNQGGGQWGHVPPPPLF